MSESEPFPFYISPKLTDDLDREDKNEFVQKYNFRDGRIREYKKAKKLESAVENIGVGFMLLAFFLFLP